MAFVQSIETRLARSARNLVLADADFAAYYAWGPARHNVRVTNPEVDPELIRVPTLIIQTVPDRDALTRLVGANLRTTANLRFILFERADTAPIDGRKQAEASVITLVDRMRHLEEILFTGYDPSGGAGKMVDPDNADSLAPKVKFLTTRLAGIYRLGVREIDLSPSSDQSTIALAVTILAAWETLTNAATGKRQGE